FLRRACILTAACRRRVRVPARGVFPAVGISLRLDLVRRDPDRDDRRGGRGVCALLLGFGPLDFGKPLPDPAGSRFYGVRVFSFYGTTGGRDGDRAPHLDELAGDSIRQTFAKHFHDRE